MKMEDILRNIARETSTAKLLPIKNACTDALTLLEDDAAMTAAECYQVRQKCLYPLQLSLESRSSRLANAAMAGLQKFFVDDRFITSIESDQQECWFPMQVLKTVQNAPNMQEDVQVEIMKLLLKMSFSTAWCLNAIVITKITELALDIYGPSSQISVKTAAKATVTQLLTSITEKLQEKQMATQEDKNKSNIMDEYSSKNSILADASALCHDVVSILQFLCDKLEKLPSTPTAKSTEPLLLEAIYTVLHNSPISIKENPVFVELIWKRLSPSLIGLLGNPVTDKSLLTSHKKSYDDEIGRGSGSTTTAPPMANAPAKSIYSISVELVRLVGSLKSLRPVLESIFHRMLLYPAAIYRHEALLTIAEVLKTPEFLVNLAGPTLSDKNSTTNTGASKKRLYTDVALLKLIVDSIEECCHCDNSAVCITSVQLIADLLTSVEELVKGQGLTDYMVTEIHAQYKETDAYIEPEVEGSSGLPSYLGRTIHPIPLIPLPKLEEEFNCKGIEADHTRALLDQDTGEEIIHDAESGDVAANMACDLASDVAGGVSSDVASDVADDMDDNIDTNSEDGLLTVEQETPPTVEAPPSIEVPPTIEALPTIEAPPSTEAVPVVETPPVIRSELESQARQAMLQKKAAYDLVEKESAQIYIHKLQEMLPSLLQSYSIHDIDQQLLLFASELCEENVQESHTHNGPSATLNGDGVYLATMYTLLLNLKLICAGYYTSEEKSLPISEERFLDEILGSGLIVYLSPVWVSSVYHQVINVNLLEEAGFGENNADVPLIHLLTDIDGLGSRQIGGQLMTSFSSNSDLLGQRSINEGQEPKDKITIEAGQKFARRLLLVCWDSILEVLSVLLNGSSACGITSSLALLVGGMEETQRARQAVCTSLDGLQKAARLSCILGLQDRCGAVFSQLAASCCVIEDFRREERKATKPGNKPSVLPSAKPKLTKLHTSHALSMDVVLCIGLEMGSHSADCWKHVFRCCAHLSELEHTYFSSGDNQTNLPKVGLHQEQMNQHMDNGAFDMEMDELYTGVVTSVEPIAPSINVADLINKSRSEAGWDSAMMGREVLSANQAAQVLCGLSQQVDRLFEDASNKMNMKAFVSFIRELCQASQDQLSAYSHYSDLHGPGCPSIPNNALHLYRLGDVLMRCIEGDRPMIHVMKAWSVAVPHLVDCACHWDHNISKKAVNCIHEFITNLLSKHKEHQHFHFNEALCKPFENLVCLELCDGDTQDQIVCSICELVEACANDIHSGWRPLFGALRAIKVEYTTMEDVNEARQRHIEAVLDVFDVFLNSDNIIVFAYAAVDCIMCLLKYVKGPGEFESVGDGDSDSGSELTPATLGEDLCLPALKYLQQCCTLLGSMWTMPACPIFHAANSIHIAPIPKIVDPIIHGIDLKAFQKPFNEHKLNVEKKDIPPTTDDKDPPTDTKDPLTDTKDPPTDAIALPTNYLSEENQAASSSREVSPGRGEAQDAKSVTSNDSGIQGEETQHTDNVQTDPAADTPTFLSSQYIGTPLEQLDKPTGVLRVWYLVLDGLAMTANSCPKTFQPQTLEVLFDLLRSAAKLPGPEFSLHCMNHLVLPMIQNWLRKGAHLSTFWDGSVSNFRQCCGLCTDLVVEYVIQFATVSEHQVAVHFMLQQLLDVLTECVSQSNEALARLGCSCIRHCIMSTGQVAHESVWRLMLDSLERALDITLYSLKQLMTPFKEDSDNFYGDVGHVKIAVRKDCSGIECERLRQLAQQVFLLDNQRGTSSIIDYEVEEDRSYIFLIYPPNHEQAPNPNLIVTRVPFRNLVVGLLSHQLLIQLIGTLLLQGSTFMVKSERNVLPQTPLEQEPPQTPTSPTQKNLLHEENLPGMLPHLSTRNVLLLLTCLEKSYFIASQFDCRPGLKFLVQKVSRADVATNLYCYSSLSLTFLMHTLIVINSHMDNVCLENTRKILSQPQQIDANLSLDSDLLDDPIELTHKIGYTTEYITALSSLSSIDQHSGLFLRRLRVWFDEICKVYVDLYLDKEGPSKADELSSNMLVFLLAPEEELPQIKRDKSISEMVAEKLKSKKRADSVEQTEPVAVQPKISDVDQSSFDAGSEFPSNTCPTSPVKDRHQTCNDDKVYRVVTDKGIQSMMSEYKKRKQQKTMPAFVKAQRSKPVKKIPRPISLDPIDKEIDQQQQQSIMKDGEAHLVSFIEMLVSVLDVLFQLPDSHFQALQPAAFHCITQLICHCKDLRLRRSLAQWTHRIGHMFSLTAPNEAINKY